MPPLFRPCKYEDGFRDPTQIQWNNQISKFVEADGTLHDRTRCESLRSQKLKLTPPQSSSPLAPQQQVQSPTTTIPTITTMATYDVANALNEINRRLEELSEYYSGLYEHIKNQHKAAEAEAQYDQDKEDGIV